MFSVKAVSDFKQVSRKALIFGFFFIFVKKKIYTYI